MAAGALLMACVAASHEPALSQSPATPTSSAVQGTASAIESSTAKSRALLDQYCVTCHSDRLKTANLSLEHLDLANVGDDPALWERVVRKLRAGVMPPPDVRRPTLAEYEGLRDFLEAQLDRHAAGRVNPGAVVLHRLNRTEYANAIRDLLDVRIDVASLLPDAGDTLSQFPPLIVDADVAQFNTLRPAFNTPKLCVGSTPPPSTPVKSNPLRLTRMVCAGWLMISVTSTFCD